MQQNKHSFFLLICFSFFLIEKATAQKFTSSPYSRFGIGQITSKNFAQSNAMGGSCIALKNDTLLPVFINVANPASYSSVGITTFEAGINTAFNRFSNSNSSYQSNNTSLNYITLAFPMGRRMGGCFGIMPLSSIGYNIYHTTEVSNIGSVKGNYEGDGGFNQLHMGLGWRPFSKAFDNYKNSSRFQKDLHDSTNTVKASRKVFLKKYLSSISIGANGYYYFGVNNTVSRLIFPNEKNTFNTRVTRQAQVSDFSGSFGLLSTFTIDSIRSTKRDTVKNSARYGKHKKRNLRENIDITLGYTYSMNNSLKAYYSEVASTFIYYGSSEQSRDTIYKIIDQKGTITLPMMHGVGVSIRKGAKLNILADFEMQLWSGFKYFNDINYLHDMKRISFGAEYIPNKFAHGKGDYLKRVHYRIGARYNDGYLMINNHKINDYAVTLGFGFPVGANKVFNTFNLSVEAGQMGATSNNLIKHEYIKGTIGFTFSDRWFIKYKYD